MTTREAIDLVNRFRSRHREWKIRAEPTPSDGLKVIFTHDALCSRGRKLNKEIDHIHYINPKYTDNGILRAYVEMWWKDAWVHESLEWFEFDGTLVDDPHKGEEGIE